MSNFSGSNGVEGSGQKVEAKRTHHEILEGKPGSQAKRFLVQIYCRTALNAPIIMQKLINVWNRSNDWGKLVLPKCYAGCICSVYYLIFIMSPEHGSLSLFYNYHYYSPY